MKLIFLSLSVGLMTGPGFYKQNLSCVRIEQPGPDGYAMVIVVGAMALFEQFHGNSVGGIWCDIIIRMTQ